MLTFIGVAVYSIFTIVYVMNLKKKLNARVNVMNERISGMWEELKKVSHGIEDVEMIRRDEIHRLREIVAVNSEIKKLKLQIKELENALKVIMQVR